jgi:glutamate synthase domain-containing protein 3
VSALGVVPALELDAEALGVRALNAQLQSAAAGARFTLARPGGRHAIAAGLNAPIDVEVLGHAGYYCAGMNQAATVTLRGNAGVGVAENMMSGRVEVIGNAGQSAAASAHGGLLIVRGDAAARCAISLKGADVVVAGSVGHASAFMAQAGRVLVLGAAGDGLGDSIYEARLYVLGAVSSLGADCIEKPMREEHVADASALLTAAGIGGVDVGALRRYGSARRLYHWQPRREAMS